MATVLGVYWTGRVLWGRGAGAWGAALCLLMFPFSYYARLGNLDMPALAWTSLGLAAAAEILRGGLTPARGVWLGIFVALAGATKDQAAGSFVLLGLAILVLHVASRARHRVGRFEGPWVAPAALVSALGVAYVLASGVPLNVGRFIRHVGIVLSVGPGVGTRLYLRHADGLAGTWAQIVDLSAHLGDVLGLPFLAASLFGIGLALVRDRGAFLLVLSAVGFFAILVPVGFSRIHYLLPIALVLCPFAGFALASLGEHSKRARVATLGVGIAALGHLSLRTVDLTHALIQDGRIEATEWLAGSTEPGDRVLFFGAGLKNPHLPARVRDLAVQRAADGLPMIQSERPEWVIVMPEDTDENRERVNYWDGPYSVRSRYVSDAVWAGLLDGSLGYRLVARFQTPRLLPGAYRPPLSYGCVNPPVQIFVRTDRAPDLPELEAWLEAPHNPPIRRINEPLRRS